MGFVSGLRRALIPGERLFNCVSSTACISGFNTAWLFPFYNNVLLRKEKKKIQSLGLHFFLGKAKKNQAKIVQNAAVPIPSGRYRAAVLV